MQGELRRTLDVAYERMKRPQSVPIAHSGDYGLCLGIIVGSEVCAGLTRDEAASERAHLAMLVALYEMQAQGRSGPGG